MSGRNSYVAAILTATLIWSTSPQVTWATPNDTAFEDLLERVGFDSEKGDTTDALAAVASYVRQETYRLNDDEKLKVAAEYLKAVVDYCDQPIHSEKSIRACYEAVRQMTADTEAQHVPREANFAQIGPQNRTGIAIYSTLMILVIIVALVRRTDRVRGAIKGVMERISRRNVEGALERLGRDQTFGLLSQDVAVWTAVIRARSRYLTADAFKQLGWQEISLQPQDILAMTDDELVNLFNSIVKNDLCSLEATAVFGKAIYDLHKIRPATRLAWAKSLASTSPSMNLSTMSFLSSLITVTAGLDGLVRVEAMTPETIDHRIEEHRKTHGFQETFTPKE